MAKNSDFENFSQLLPFYVNGSLGAADCAQVDAALATSPALREELAALGQLAQGIKAGGRTLEKGDAERAERIAVRLEQAIASQTRIVANDRAAVAPRSGLADLLAFFHPKRWHPVVAFSLALAIIAQAGIIAKLAGDNSQGALKIALLEKTLDKAGFQLASGPGGEAADMARLIVQINPDARWADVETLLSKEGLKIIAGPSDGALTLSGEASGTALDAMILRLQASAMITAVDKAV